MFNGREFFGGAGVRTVVKARSFGRIVSVLTLNPDLICPLRA
jgi:hypothetical protein